METPKFLLLWALAIAAVDYVGADTLADCRYEEIKGIWKFEVGPDDNNRTIKCKEFKAATTMTVTLSYPNNVTDEYGNKGTWTLIYNQGFEVIVAGRKYFAFSYYDRSAKKQYCNRVEGGWSHDVLGNNWACYKGEKIGNITEIDVQEIGTDRDSSKTRSRQSKRTRYSINSQELVDKINSAQNLWQAKVYPQFEGYTTRDFLQLTGGKASRISEYPRPAPFTARDEEIMKSLPESFDWRDVDGVNYVSPVRDQGWCGSCYAFASQGMAEARVRIQTNNTQQPVYSPQDVIECCEYSQGCEGGFNYLVAGKYAEDYGYVLNECNGYMGQDHPCDTDPKCERFYSTDYSYIGGYYGACNEARMMEAIYKRGPIAIGMNYPDYFFNYVNGIMTCDRNMLEDVDVGFDPFEECNHALVIVGWGYDKEKKEKYWTIKNSWGKNWAYKGYFYVRKGKDDCHIESIAMEASPIIKI